MTDPVVRLEPTRLTVEPGGQVRAVLTVRNVGTIVEGFRVDVVGAAPSAWAEVTPGDLSVYPQQESTAVVLFSPPAGRAAPGGSFPFGVRVTSEVDPSVSAVAEGDIDVGQVHGLQAKLTPVTSAGRWRGRHTIQVSNWGNAPARLRFVVTDPDEMLGFLVRPGSVDLPLGSSAVARLKVRSRHPFLRGTPVRRPFQVVAEPDPPDSGGQPVGPAYPGDPRRPVLDGAFTQRPVLAKAPVVLACLLALAIVGVFAYALRGGPGLPDIAGANAPVASSPSSAAGSTTSGPPSSSGSSSAGSSGSSSGAASGGSLGPVPVSVPVVVIDAGENLGEIQTELNALLAKQVPAKLGSGSALANPLPYILYLGPFPDAATASAMSQQWGPTIQSTISRVPVPTVLRAASPAPS